MLSSRISRLFAKPTKGSDVPRIHISLVGFMNAGKSSVMNAITRQPTSIVDETPGTTADTKVALMEIHQIGPCKLLDTAGVDEVGPLGAKKFTKALSAVKESDVVLYVIDPGNFRVGPFRDLFALTERRGKTSAVVFNHFRPPSPDTERDLMARITREVGRPLPSVSVQASNRQATYEKVVPFIAKLKTAAEIVPLIPHKFLGPDKTLFLNIPLDVESPTGRLLRPQTLVVEYALRRASPIMSFCLNLKAARSAAFEAEQQRFLKSLNAVHPSLVITDSQAIDILYRWTPPDIPLTTFSITMANMQTNGKLKAFARGIEALGRLRPGNRVLICEACNHDRIGDDIGTVQLPGKLRKLYPWIKIDWAFGRAYEDKKLSDYALAFHCGGCMISRQQMAARVQDLLETGVPVVNYGLALSWLASPSLALERVLKPWELALTIEWLIVRVPIPGLKRALKIQKQEQDIQR